jgi:hypothetical protein
LLVDVAVGLLPPLTRQFGRDSGRKAVAAAPICEQQIGQMRN